MVEVVEEADGADPLGELRMQVPCLAAEVTPREVGHAPGTRSGKLG